MIYKVKKESRKRKADQQKNGENAKKPKKEKIVADEEQDLNEKV
jgi:hypothetical protein